MELDEIGFDTLEKFKGKISISIPTTYKSDILQGVHHKLSSMLYRFTSELGGILMSYRKVKIKSYNADLPNFNVKIWGKFFYLQPFTGTKVQGKIVNIDLNNGGINFTIFNRFQIYVPVPEGNSELKKYSVGSVADLELIKCFIEGDLVKFQAKILNGHEVTAKNPLKRKLELNSDEPDGFQSPQVSRPTKGTPAASRFGLPSTPDISHIQRNGGGGKKVMVNSPALAHHGTSTPTAAAAVEKVSSRPDEMRPPAAEAAKTKDSSKKSSDETRDASLPPGWQRVRVVRESGRKVTAYERIADGLRLTNKKKVLELTAQQQSGEEEKKKPKEAAEKKRTTPSKKSSQSESSLTKEDVIAECTKRLTQPNEDAVFEDLLKIHHLSTSGV